MEEYKNHFTEIECPSPAKTRASGTTMSFLAQKEEVWDEALSVIAQYALVIRTKHPEGTIFFVDVDGVLRDGEYIYLQFPFAVLIEGEAGRTAVYVSPMLDLVREGLSGGELELATAVSKQKGQEFLAHLSVQLEASERWPWLVR
jgi:hypothetical protein